MTSPPPLSSSPPSPTNVTTPPTVTFPLRPPSNESSISSEPNPSPPDQTSSSGGSALVALGVGIGIGGAVVLLLVAVFVFWFTRRKRRRCSLADDLLGLKDSYFTAMHSVDSFGGAPQDWQNNAPPSNKKKDGLPPKFTNSSSNFQLSSSSTSSEKPNTSNMSYGNNKTIFTYEDLANATRDFSQANFLGQGGFGYVHKGVLPSGEKVAIKQLKIGSGQGEREFQAEVAIISRVHHKNLVSLVGYCASGLQRMLVYEFVPNNTLEFHLHGKGSDFLNWDMRMKIALGSAKGLAYLHEDCELIRNYLLPLLKYFNCQDTEPVADFGLARFSPETDTHVSTRVIGTFGSAPEYALTGKLTDKSDVFSFGVVLLELITGRQPIDKAQFLDDNIVDWARPLLTQVLENGDFSSLVDTKLQNNYEFTEMSRMIACADVCVRHLARRRPSMSQLKWTYKA
ncbi:hypothetical protein M8C21_029437 [Ambrosia artemisiifolia]|uniref:non-specific serine/threonine protein kinase n=1 Tax=Ambrosia artemisiifolia TaxID=4212 RepID=A0AAD5G5U5_AMBAR|nr:hypothetical protein M8C21_029437 [Ambrosia artemisiifolia]